jgi:hypothetical protein
MGERVACLENEVQDLSHIIKGNGQRGLDEVTRDFIAEWRGREAERDRQRKRLEWIIGIILSLFGLWLTSIEVRHMISKDTHPFLSSDRYSQQNATDGPMRP